MSNYCNTHNVMPTNLICFDLGTTEPMWNQTFIYSGLRRADLRQRALEITVWDYVRYGANDFLGESIVELWPLDEQPTWRTLGPHEEVALTPSEHLSPPSTGSRFSDSDTPSECEIDGSRERRGADGASVSSVGSSSSPPRENERKSRRDQETMHTSQRYARVYIKQITIYNYLYCYIFKGWYVWSTFTFSCSM